MGGVGVGGEGVPPVDGGGVGGDGAAWVDAAGREDGEGFAGGWEGGDAQEGEGEEEEVAEHREGGRGGSSVDGWKKTSMCNHG